MFVKICGITNREDALAAIDSGARALGFIFHPPSPRYVTPEALEPWIAEVPADIWKVGVFVNQDPRRIEQIAAQLHLDVAQLHGNETPDRHPHNLRIWKAFRVNGKGSPPPSYPAEAILLAGSDAQKRKWLPLIASGDAIGTLALFEGKGNPSPAAIKLAASGGSLNGGKKPVADGAIADFAVVAAKIQSHQRRG